MGPLIKHSAKVFFVVINVMVVNYRYIGMKSIVFIFFCYKQWAILVSRSSTSRSGKGIGGGGGRGKGGGRTKHIKKGVWVWV